MVLDLCARVLKDMDGCDVLQAGNADDALEISTRHDGQIDLLLSDIVMDGGTSGIELAERVRSSRPETKILLMSGFNDEKPGLPHGWYFIAKPFLPAALMQKVDEVLLHP